MVVLAGSRVRVQTIPQNKVNRVLQKMRDEWWVHKNNPDMILVWPEALLVWVVVVGLFVYCVVKS